MENRLAELETRVAFQDDTIQTLNDVIARQQRQIDQMKTMLDDIKAELERLAPAITAPEKPPHY